MIDLKSQSQAMRLEKFGKGARDVGDSVLYHSLPELASPRVYCADGPQPTD